MRLLFLLMLHHAIATAYDCNIFFNYFTVNNGEFTDVCGNITMFGYNTDGNYLSSAYLTDHVNSNDSTFRIEGGEYVAYTMVPFDSNQWAIVYEGYSTKIIKSGFNIILGPGGDSKNNQLRYDDGDRICISSYYSSVYEKCISLLYDINVMHSLIFYYNNSVLSVYQNNEYVGSLSGTLQTAYAKIGGWYHTYSGNLAVKNVMFSTNVALHDIRQYGIPPSTNPSVTPTALPTTINPSFAPTTLVTTRNPSVIPTALVTATLVPISFISTTMIPTTSNPTTSAPIASTPITSFPTSSPITDLLTTTNTPISIQPTTSQPTQGEGNSDDSTTNTAENTNLNTEDTTQLSQNGIHIAIAAVFIVLSICFFFYCVYKKYKNNIYKLYGGVELVDAANHSNLNKLTNNPNDNDDDIIGKIDLQRDQTDIKNKYLTKLDDGEQLQNNVFIQRNVVAQDLQIEGNYNIHMYKKDLNYQTKTEISTSDSSDDNHDGKTNTTNGKANINDLINEGEIEQMHGILEINNHEKREDNKLYLNSEPILDNPNIINTVNLDI